MCPPTHRFAPYKWLVSVQRLQPVNGHCACTFEPAPAVPVLLPPKGQKKGHLHHKNESGIGQVVQKLH